MTNFGDVIVDAKGGSLRYQSSITVASSPDGPNPMQYNREDAEILTDAQASGIAQDLAGEGVDSGYYNQYSDPEFRYAVNGVPITSPDPPRFPSTVNSQLYGLHGTLAVTSAVAP